LASTGKWTAKAENVIINGSLTPWNIFLRLPMAAENKLENARKSAYLRQVK